MLKSKEGKVLAKRYIRFRSLHSRWTCSASLRKQLRGTLILRIDTKNDTAGSTDGFGGPIS